MAGVVGRVSRLGRSGMSAKREIERSGVDTSKVGEGHIGIGFDRGGVAAKINTDGTLTLGVGVAKIEWNLKDPNESTISMGFDTFELSGEKINECQVRLSYKFLGGEYFSEIRDIESDECQGKEPGTPGEAEPLDVGDVDADDIDDENVARDPTGKPIVDEEGNGFTVPDPNDFGTGAAIAYYGEIYNSEAGNHMNYPYLYKGISSASYYSTIPNSIRTERKSNGDWEVAIDWTHVNKFAWNPGMVQACRHGEERSAGEAGGRTDTTRYENSEIIMYHADSKVYRDSSGRYLYRWWQGRFYSNLRIYSNMRARLTRENPYYSHSGEQSQVLKVTSDHCWDIGQVTTKNVQSYAGFHFICTLDGSHCWHSSKVPLKSKKPQNTIRIPPMDEACCGMIRRIYENLGVERFPMELPKNITVDPDSPDDSTIKVEDWVDAYAYRFDIDDERFGQFQIPIEIVDIDPTKEGNQTEKIKFANLAEAIAEMTGLIYTILSQNMIAQDLGVKNLQETGLIRLAAMRTGLNLEELIEYIGYKCNEKKSKLRMQFTPDGQGFDDYLQPSQQEFKFLENEEKRTLAQDLQVLKESAKLIRTVFGLEVDKHNPELGILEELTSTLKHFEDIDKVLKEQNDKAQEHFKDNFPDMEIESDYVADQDKLKGF